MKPRVSQVSRISETVLGRAEAKVVEGEPEIVEDNEPYGTSVDTVVGRNELLSQLWIPALQITASCTPLTHHLTVGLPVTPKEMSHTKDYISIYTVGESVSARVESSASTVPTLQA